MGNFQEVYLREPTQLEGSPLMPSHVSLHPQTFHLRTGTLIFILDYVVIFRMEAMPLVIG